MKTTAFSLLILFCLPGFSQTAQKPLRHFMQAGPSPSNEIQYGNNAAPMRHIPYFW
jgi:hypothetical protein